MKIKPKSSSTYFLEYDVKAQPKQSVSLHHLGSELHLHIFKFLHPQDLQQIGSVCKTWHPIGMEVWKDIDLKKFFPYIFLNEDWNHFKIPVEPRILNKHALFRLLNSKCRFSQKEEKIWQTHTLLEMPKGLTVENELTLLNQVFSRHVIVWNLVQQECNRIPIAETHCVIILNNMISNRTNASFGAQGALLDHYPGYEIPSLAAIVALDITKFVRGGRYQEMATYCQERPQEDFRPHHVATIQKKYYLKVITSSTSDPESYTHSESIGLVPMQTLNSKKIYIQQKIKTSK